MASIVLVNLAVIITMRETLMRKIELRSLKGIDRIVLAYIFVLSVFALELLLQIESPLVTYPLWAKYLFYRLENLLSSILESIFLYYGFMMRTVEIKLHIGTLELRVIISKLRN